MISRVFVIALLTLWFVIPGAKSIRSLESVPASNGSVLSAGVGQQISLTCSHDNEVSAATLWKISAPVVCSTAIAHIIAASGVVDCGPFSFVNVTQGTSALFTSTAVATANTSMTGAVVQCLDGVSTSAVQVGSNITLCVYEPWWVIVIFVALAVVIVAIIVLMVKYKRVIFRCCHSGEMEDPPDKTDSFYQDPSTIQHQQATGGDLYALPDMLKKGSKKEKSEEALADMSSVPDNSKKSQDPSTIQHQQAAGGDLYALPDMLKKGSKKEKSEEALADMYSVPDKSKKSQLTSADIDMGGGSGRPVNPVPPMEYPTDGTSVEHEQAPSGEEYEVVTTAKKTVAVDSICQHEQATGDGHYEDIDKPRKGSKNEKSEEALADMSSVPDNSKKSQLTYADMGGESGKPVNPVRQI